MRILIDGYNVLHASSAVPTASSTGTLDAIRRAFLDHLLEKLPPRMAAQTTVVFDVGTERGLPAETTYGSLTVKFAVSHPEADDLLEELIRGCHVPRRLTVVSSDHRVQRAARRRRATAVDSDIWLQRLERRPAARQQPGTPGPSASGSLQSVNWLEEFGDIDVGQIERDLAKDRREPLTPPAPGPASDQGRPRRDLSKPKPQPRGAQAEPVFPPEYLRDILRELEQHEGAESIFPDEYLEDLD